MRIVSRKEAGETVELYKEIIDSESHSHPIVETIEGGSEVWRWKTDPEIEALVDKVDFNELIMFLYKHDYTKNGELWRHLYRSIGYSLSGYWEIFYWDLNNEDANEYEYQEDPSVDRELKSILKSLIVVGN